MLSTLSPSLSENSSLKKRLLSKGIVSQDQIVIALKEAKAQDKTLGQALISLGFITPKVLQDALSEAAGWDAIDLSKIVIDTEIRQRLPQEIALRYKMLPLYKHENTVHIALCESHNIIAQDHLRRYFPSPEKINLCIAPEQDILDMIQGSYYRGNTLEELFQELEKIHTQEDQNTKHNSLFNLEDNKSIQLVHSIIFHGVRLGASDIHFHPEESFIRLRYRLDGFLEQITSFHKEIWSRICVRLKLLGNMNIAESRKPQNGRFTLTMGARDVDFRVASHPTIHGESLVLRILDKTKSLRPLEELGFTPSQVELLKTSLKKPQGLYVITGPTGSGKTTTLYSMLSYLQSSDLNLMTLEDPVEYKLPFIRQSEIHNGGGISFAEGVRSLLRQDPDVIFIGEIRDEETAQIALRAAMTGHRVLTTLHTNDAFGVIQRFKDLGVSPQDLAENLVFATAQRLLRKYCTTCKARINNQEVFPNAETAMLQSLGAPTPAEEKASEAIYCSTCQGRGYKGRIAVTEILSFTENFKKAILQGATSDKLLALAKEQGFSPLWDQGLALTEAGITSQAEVKRHL